MCVVLTVKDKERGNLEFEILILKIIGSATVLIAIAMSASGLRIRSGGWATMCWNSWYVDRVWKAKSKRSANKASFQLWRTSSRLISLAALVEFSIKL